MCKKKSLWNLITISIRNRNMNKVKNITDKRIDSTIHNKKTWHSFDELTFTKKIAQYKRKTKTKKGLKKNLMSHRGSKNNKFLKFKGKTQIVKAFLFNILKERKRWTKNKLMLYREKMNINRLKKNLK